MYRFILLSLLLGLAPNTSFAADGTNPNYNKPQAEQPSSTETPSPTPAPTEAAPQAEQTQSAENPENATEQETTETTETETTETETTETTQEPTPPPASKPPPAPSSTADHGDGHFTIEAMWNQSSGPVRAVLLTLLIMMIGCFAVAFERFLFFSKQKNQSAQLAGQVGPLFAKGDFKSILSLARKEEYKNSYLGKMINSGLTEFDARQDHYGIEAVERALEKQSVLVDEGLRNWFNILATTGSTAPFVGLVGTIFGIINAFSMIGSDGGADLTTLAPAIGEALITTAFGIIVAIVGVWLFNFFTAQVEGVVNDVTRSAQDLIDWCHKQINPPVDKAAK